MSVDWLDWCSAMITPSRSYYNLLCLLVCVHSFVNMCWSWISQKWLEGMNASHVIHLQCESEKILPWGLVVIFPKRLGIFQPCFTRLLRVPIYARLRICTELSATLTKLCHIKRDHPVHIICAKCLPSAETHAGIFWHFPQTVKNF